MNGETERRVGPLEILIINGEKLEILIMNGERDRGKSHGKLKFM